MISTSLSRRGLLASAAGSLAFSAASGAAPKADSPAEDVRLGVASYSLRKLSRADAIKALQKMNIKLVNVKDFHLSLKSTKEEIAQARKEFEDAGIQIGGCGNITMQKNDPDAIRSYFEYAKALGCPVIVMAPSRETLPVIEKMVKEYDIKAAIHNHGPEDKHFPAPSDVLKEVKNMDMRMGLCVDIGHTTRTNVDILEAIKQAGARMHDMHIKDLRDLMAKDSQVPVGDGAMPIPGIFKLLKKMKFQGGVMLEYEIEADNPVPGMIKSFAYMRGVLAGLRG